MKLSGPGIPGNAQPEKGCCGQPGSGRGECAQSPALRSASIFHPAAPQSTSGNNIVVTADGEGRYEAVFRERWRDRQSGGARPGELIRQPGWIDAGLVALGVLLAGGVAAAATMTLARSEALPAVVQDNSVTAVLADAAAPAPGTAVQFRDESGATFDAVVVNVSATEVTAQLTQPGPAAAGKLLVPSGRQRVISLLLPRLW
jgi:hypothetical protein